jgi:hypothetical protein
LRYIFVTRGDEKKISHRGLQRAEEKEGTEESKIGQEDFEHQGIAPDLQNRATASTISFAHAGPSMSKHHHHPHEGHSAGNPPGTGRGHLRHNWFFYLAGVMILLALLAFIFSGNLAWRPAISSPQPAPSSDAAK